MQGAVCYADRSSSLGCEAMQVLPGLRLRLDMYVCFPAISATTPTVWTWPY
jgi:hypothetical protein